MRARWLERRDESLARRALLSPLAPVGWLYGLGARLHRGAYQRGLLTPRRLGCRVVSVGSLVVGGSGKTPLAAWIARSLRERGHRVAIATRGFGRAGRVPVVVVSDGRRLHCGPELAGDEPLVLAGHAPEVPVLVGRDRGKVGLRAIAAFGAEVLVLDDGLQHHRLHRDVELVAFDGEFGLGNGHVLPWGPLREPRAALAHADAAFVLDGPLVERDESLLDRVAPLARRFEARRRIHGLRDLEAGEWQSARSLAGQEVGLIAGLARADGFRRSIESLGARVVAERRFGDHHRYRSRDLEGLAGAAPQWITTEKDAVKIVPSWRRGARIRILRIELDVVEPQAVLEWLEARLRA